MKQKRISLVLCVLVVLFIVSAAMAAPKPITVTVDEAQRTLLHSKVDALESTLVDVLLTGSDYDVTSRAGGQIENRIYPFRAPDSARNDYEATRKTAKYDWAYNMAMGLNFPRVVRYQPDKFFYAEIGDADAPEMVLALSHLDSNQAAVGEDYDLPRWRNKAGQYGAPGAYHDPYVKDGWIYGAGVQDDSGPTLATLIAMKAIMDANLPFDRRIRVGMGIYEDGGPAQPTTNELVAYIDIPYIPYSDSSSVRLSNFYDNWAYKYLNREEMPIAAFTSDSRFPVVQGNRRAGNRLVTYDLSADSDRGFRLMTGDMAITLRDGDPTLKDIQFGSTNQVPSRALFSLNVSSVETSIATAFVNAVNAEILAQGWEGKAVITQSEDFRLTIEINTDVAMEMPTPMYGKNAIVWGMHLLSKGFAAIQSSYPAISDLTLKRLADSVARMFIPNGVEDYYGTEMGANGRNPDSEVPLMVISFGALPNADTSPTWTNFYIPSSKEFSLILYIGSMHSNADAYNAAQEKLTDAFDVDGWDIADAPGFGNGPTLYMKHDNILTALQMASYRNSVAAPGFEDIAALNEHAYPVGTTGGTLASDFWNKMNAFGAILPGNERWWHTANERMTVKSAVQMTKAFADGMVEMARYIGPAGAKMMWADIPGYNADRADLDLLDVVLDTYKDARDAVPASAYNGRVLAAATAFDIPMFAARFNGGRTDAAIAAEHGEGGIYLPLNDADFVANTFVLPMRLEFKISKSSLTGVSEAAWNTLRTGTVSDAMSMFKFGLIKDSATHELALPSGQTADKFFFKRAPANDPDNIYIAVNLAIGDSTGDATPRTVLADSKTDLFKLNPAYEAANGNPWPERGAVTERGFFLFGDGAKDARFISPSAVFVTFSASGSQDPTTPTTTEPTSTVPTDDGDGGGCNVLFGILPLLLVPFLRRKK